MNTETDVIDTTAVVVTVIPTEQLAEINATEQGLAQLRSRASELAALGVPQTKEAYDEVHRITMVSVKVRTESDKLAKRLAAPFKEKYDVIRAEGKRIGDHAAQSEALTRPLKEQYEAEQERLRIEAEKAAAARIQSRVDSLLKIGFNYEDGAYYGPAQTIESIEVQALPDDEFEELYRVGSEAWNVLVEQLAEMKRQEDAEALRIKQEEIAEADRLRAERQAEAERLRIEKEQQQAEAKRQQDEAKRLNDERAELNKMKLESRQDKLASFGFMATHGNSMRIRLSAAQYERNFPNADLVAMSTEEFNDVLTEVKAQVNRENELIGRRVVFSQRSAALVETGVYQVEGDDKRVSWIGDTHYYSFDELVHLPEEGFAMALQQAKDEQQSRIDAANKKTSDDAKAAADEAKAKLKADKERTARLKGDKGEIAKWVGSITKLTLGRAVPDMTQPETLELLDDLSADLLTVAKRYMDRITAL